MSVTRLLSSSSMKSTERAAQFFGVDATRLHHAGCVGFVDQRQQKMFQCCKLMATCVGKGQRGMNCLLKCV